MNQTNKSTINLFVYGSLKEPSIFQAVTGINPPSQHKAILHGFSYTQPIDGYPVIQSDPNGIVEGIIIKDIPSHKLNALNHYEGDAYQRQKVKIQLEDEDIEAFTYIKR